VRGLNRPDTGKDDDNKNHNNKLNYYDWSEFLATVPETRVRFLALPATRFSEK
jgi:hypothetical protein